MWSSLTTPNSMSKCNQSIKVVTGDCAFSSNIFQTVDLHLFILKQSDLQDSCTDGIQRDMLIFRSHVLLNSHMLWGHPMLRWFSTSSSSIFVDLRGRVQGNRWNGWRGSKVGYFGLLDGRKSLSMVYIWMFDCIWI